MSDSTSLFKRGLKSALGIFLTQTQVTQIEPITENFSLIEITGSKLKETKWAPGGKLQINVGAFTFRTYTPIQVDRSKGALTFLCYRRKGNPATNWIDSLKPGSSCEVFGPKDSLDFSKAQGKIVLFGDETSIGISKALQSVAGKQAQVFLEVNSVQESSTALQRVGVENAKTIQRSSDDTHLQQIAKSITELNSASGGLSAIFLVGRASSIQKIRTFLKDSGIPSNILKTRAYWADGKTGLD